MDETAQNLLIKQEEETQIAIDSKKERDRLEGVAAQRRLLRQERPRATRAFTKRVENQEEISAQIEAENQEINIINIISFLTRDRAREVLEEGGEDLEDDEIDELRENPPELPQFPTIIFSLAIVKDTLDVIVTVTIIGAAATFVYGAFYNIIIFAWLLNKASKPSLAQRLVIKKIRTKIALRFAGTSLVETMPFLGVLPLATFFVLLTHYGETKVVKLFLRAVDAMEEVEI